MMTSLNFSLDPLGYWHSPGYRGLTYKEAWAGTSKIHKGWDVYALQTGLNVFADPPITLDGVLGPRTLEAITRFQRNRNLLVDGVAGNATQFTLVRGIAPKATATHGLPRNGIKGAVESESGNWLGNHTALYERDNSWDLGVVQVNDVHKGVTRDQAFDVVWALDYYAKTIRTAYNKYSEFDMIRDQRLASRGLPTGLTEERLWSLAFGSWNRPAHTNWLAGEPASDTQEPITGPLTQAQRTWIEGYINRVTVYITDWTP